MDIAYRTDKLPYDGPPDLEAAWQHYADRYFEDSTSNDKLLHLKLFNDLLFRHDHIRDFIEQNRRDGLDHNRCTAILEDVAGKLADLSADEEFRPLHTVVEKRLMEKWVAIRDSSGINPRGLQGVTIEAKKEEKAKRKLFSEEPSAYLLSNTVFHVLPIMPTCYDVLGPSAARFTKSQIKQEASALFPSAMYTYRLDAGAKFLTYFRNAWLEKQLWRKLADHLADETQSDISLNQMVAGSSKGDGSELGNMLADTKADDPHEMAAVADMWGKLSDVIVKELSPREAHVIRLRYGLADDFKPHRGEENAPQPMTLEQTGEELGVTPERVRQLQARAMRKLMLHTSDLRDSLSPDAAAPPPVKKPPVPLAFSTGSYQSPAALPPVPEFEPVNVPPLPKPKLVFPQFDVSNQDALRALVRRMYEEPQLVDDTLAQYPPKTAEHRAAIALKTVGIPIPPFPDTHETPAPALEHILLSGMLCSPESMIPHIRLNYPGHTRLGQLLKVILAPLEVTPPPANETPPAATKSATPPVPRQHTAEPVSANQEEAIEKARRAYAAMETYSWDKAREIAEALFLELASTVVGPNIPVRLQEKAEGKIGKSTFTRWLKEKGSYNPDAFVSGNGIDSFVQGVVAEPLRDAASCFLLGMPWENKNIGIHEQVAYAQQHNMNAASFLRLTRYQTRMNTRDYADYLDINPTALSNMSYTAGESDVTNVRAPIKPILDTVAEKLGIVAAKEDDAATVAQVEEDKAVFRKMVVGMPHAITQDTLNTCFYPEVEDKKLFVDTDATGNARGQAMARFFKIMRQAHGLRDRSELADAIAAHAKLGDKVATQIRDLIHSVSVPESEIEKDADQIAHSHRLQKTIQITGVVNAIAQFAFPDAMDLQQECKHFLTHERQRAPATHPSQVRQVNEEYPRF